jgi:hypothetical protein
VSNEDKQQSISENTKINIGLVLSLLVGIIAITNFTALARNTSDQLLEFKQLVYGNLVKIQNDIDEIKKILYSKQK